MKKLSVLVLLSVFLYLSLSPAFAAVDVNTFRYQSGTTARFENPTNFFNLEIDPKLYATMDPELRDLRIYSAEEELGYTLLPFEPAETPSPGPLLPEIINKGMIRERNTYSFTLKMPPAKPGYMQIKLDRPEYLVKARLSGSNDNKTWQSLKTQTLYGINGSYNKFYLDGIDYSYLKFEYDLLKNETLEVTEAVIAEGALPKKIETPWKIKQSNDKKKKTTTVIIDLGFNNRVTQGVALVTDEDGFYRQAALAASNDQKTWKDVAVSYFYRGQDYRDENLGFSYAPVNSRYLKITIENADNKPVVFQGAKIRLLPIRLLVKAPDAATFPLTLYWGNKKIEAPAYDVNRMLALSSFNINNLPLVTVTDVKQNAGFKEQLPPLTERLPWLMPAALGAAALLVGFILFRSFKHVG